MLDAVIGAEAGNNQRKRNESDVYRTIVRLDSGNTSPVDCSSLGDLRLGDRIQVLGERLHRF